MGIRRAILGVWMTGFGVLGGYALPVRAGQETASPFFNDRTIAPWARQAVEALHREQIVHGLPAGDFRGNALATRKELVQAVFRMVLYSSRFQTRHSHRTNDALLAAFSPTESKVKPVGMETPKDLTFSWSYETTGRLLDEGLLQGYPDNYLRRSKILTRAELAAMTARLIQRLENPPTLDLDEAKFSDVSGDSWWFGAMLIAAGSGVMQGYPDGTFRGEQPVSRNELAVTLARLTSPAPDMSSPQAVWQSLITVMQNQDERTIKRLCTEKGFAFLNTDFRTREVDMSARLKRLARYQRRINAWMSAPTKTWDIEPTDAVLKLDFNTYGNTLEVFDDNYLLLFFLKTPDGWRLAGPGER